MELVAWDSFWEFRVHGATNGTSYLPKVLVRGLKCPGFTNVPVFFFCFIAFFCIFKINPKRKCKCFKSIMKQKDIEVWPN